MNLAGFRWASLWALLFLSAVPVAAGWMRVRMLWLGDHAGPDDTRFAIAPTPVVWHIVGATLFCLVGALQLNVSLRRRNPRLHRRLGWIVAPTGLVAAASGLWMTAVYRIPEALQGDFLYGVRWCVGVTMSVAIVLAVRAVKRREFDGHRNWMIRAYALGQGAGTQVLLFLPVTIALGPPTGSSRDLLMSAAWVVNLLVAEWLIRCRSSAQD